MIYDCALLSAKLGEQGKILKINAALFEFYSNNNHNDPLSASARIILFPVVDYIICLF